MFEQILDNVTGKLKRSTQSYSKEQKLLQDIKNYFDKQTAAGKEVSRGEILKKFFPETIKKYGKLSGTSAKTPALKAALGKDYDKLIYKGSQFDANKQIKEIINEVLQNKRPLADAANQKLRKLTGASKRTVTLALNQIPEYKSKIFPKLKKAVQRNNEEFFQVKLKDYDKLEKKFPRKISRPGSKQDFILQSLVRHEVQGGDLYKVVSGDNFANYKIKDTKTGEIFTRENIRKKLKQNDSKFREASRIYDELQNIKKQPFIDPITKKNIGLGKALQKATGVDAPLHIHHVKGVSVDPLNNLQVATYKANLGGQIAKSTEDFKVLGIRGVQEGGKYATGAPKFNIQENVDRFSKFANRKILSDAASGFTKIKPPSETLASKLSRQVASGAPVDAMYQLGKEVITKDLPAVVKGAGRLSKPLLTTGAKILPPAFAYMAAADIGTKLQEGYTFPEALEYGLIGTDIIGGIKKQSMLTPKEREARQVLSAPQIESLDEIGGMGYIQGPSTMSRQEAEGIMGPGLKRVQQQLEEQRAQRRAEVAKRAEGLGSLEDIYGYGP
jgi:hypothetical protein